MNDTAKIEVKPSEKLTMALLTGKPTSDDLILACIRRFHDVEEYGAGEAFDLLISVRQVLEKRAKTTTLKNLLSNTVLPQNIVDDSGETVEVIVCDSINGQGGQGYKNEMPVSLSLTRYTDQDTFTARYHQAIDDAER